MKSLALCAVLIFGQLIYSADDSHKPMLCSRVGFLLSCVKACVMANSIALATPVLNILDGNIYTISALVQTVGYSVYDLLLGSCLLSVLPFQGVVTALVGLAAPCLALGYHQKFCESSFFYWLFAKKKDKEIDSASLLEDSASLLEDGTKVPIFYHQNYNIGFFGLEKLHPFDSGKYGKVEQYLKKKLHLEDKQFYEPRKITDEELEKVMTKEYLDSLYSPYRVTSIAEVIPLIFLPNTFARRYLLDPMRYATDGTIKATQLAINPHNKRDMPSIYREDIITPKGHVEMVFAFTPTSNLPVEKCGRLIPI